MLALGKVHSDDVNVECRFSVPSGTQNYLCEVSSIDFISEGQRFVFGGVHLIGRENTDVTHVTIFNSQVPFVITEIFETFPNLIHLNYHGGGLRQIQSNAVVARRLEIFTARHNPLLMAIQTNAFAGATNLVQLILSNNSIHSVHENSLVGLQRIRVVNLNNNFVQEIPENFLRPARRLQTLFLRNNLIKTVHASTFALNNIMNQIELQDNQIDAIDRRVFEPIRELFWLTLNRNVCVDRGFMRGVTGDEELVRKVLRVCFENYDKMFNETVAN
jgi:hypothetical protein